MAKEIDQEEVSFWLQRLIGGSGQEKVQAASELSMAAVRVRGLVRVRGTLSRSAPQELPPDAMGAVLAELRNQESAVRKEVSLAVGEWGGAEAGDILARMLVGQDKDVDESVRRSVVAALHRIAGTAAVQAISQAAETDDSEIVRYDAIAALTALALQTQARRSVQSPGAVRARSVMRRSARLSPEGQQVLGTLERIRDNTNEKDYIRRIAETGITSFHR